MSEERHWRRRAEIAERREVELDREAERLREELRALIDGEGWGDDIIDDWWRNQLRAVYR